MDEKSEYPDKKSEKMKTTKSQSNRQRKNYSQSAPKESFVETNKTYEVKLQAISDLARNSIDEDKLGFAPYVIGIVSFLKSKDTDPPLGIAINGRWGQGKTSLMKMVDTELTKKTKKTKIRFSTAWFNPWKYSEDDQVWASFVDVIIRCLRKSLGLKRWFVFEPLLLFSNIKKRFNISFFLKLLIIVALGYLFFWFSLNEKLGDFFYAIVYDLLKEKGQEEFAKLEYNSLIPILGSLVIVYYLYDKVFRPLNLGILDHLKQTDFKDKIGTLSEFDDEMRQLNQCIPKKQRIAIFIDDLDRCKPIILLEIIQALQLLHVSEKCFFLLGLDLEIVAKTIEQEIPELSKAVGSDENHFQQGRGYQFLEKVIHTYINIPNYSEQNIEELVSQLLIQKVDKVSLEGQKSKPDISTENILEDSPEIKDLIKRYGTIYFKNPRRLKRFINNFRINTYLTKLIRPEQSIELLIRFLILLEKWPRLINILLENETFLDQWLEIAESEKTFGKEEIPKIYEEEEQVIFENVIKQLEQPLLKMLFISEYLINEAELKKLCDWHGFKLYRFQ